MASASIITTRPDDNPPVSGDTPRPIGQGSGQKEVYMTAQAEGTGEGGSWWDSLDLGSAVNKVGSYLGSGVDAIAGRELDRIRGNLDTKDSKGNPADNPQSGTAVAVSESFTSKYKTELILGGIIALGVGVALLYKK